MAIEEDYIMKLLEINKEDNVEQGGWDKALTEIWVGKFETTEKISANGANMILPNQNSQRNLSVSQIFNKSKVIGESLNMLLDSHMMKNTEWGAVVYLTESRYGRNGTELAINNSYYITGISSGSANATTSDTQYEYNDALYGVLASTTGNVYGVYDLSGSAYEYIMGVYGLNNFPELGNSGFDSFPNKKYYNLYTVKNNSNIGDALYETSNWNRDSNTFVDEHAPFFVRGGSYDNGYHSGMFNFVWNNGNGGSYNNSFRVCLAI